MDKIGRFEIIGKLGRGAFGMVYKGRDPVINRLAAIKVMSEATVGDPELVSRFKREAEAAGGLQHRNIVTIYDLGEHGGLPYIAMEYLEGKDLERFLKDRVDLPFDRRVDIIAQVAEGLHYAHSKGIVHRDIKPANIRMLDDGTVKIMDFGIAKMSSSDMTRTGQFMGTVNYMSPEQIKAKKIDGRSDLFAVGVVFYELLSYRRPFPGDSITAVIYKIVNENPPPLTEVHGTPHEWLESVVFKCLEKDVNKRWGSCLELAEALRHRQKVAVDVTESPIEMTINMARQKAEAGDLDSAIRQLDEVLEHDPDNTSVLRQRRSILAAKAVKGADALTAQGRLEQARDELTRALGELGESEELSRAVQGVDARIKALEAERSLERANRYLAEKRFEAAIELLTQAQQLDPYNEAVKASLMRAADEKRRADIEELLAEAKSHLDRGQLEEARARALRATEVDPASRDARAALQIIERERDLASRRAGAADAVREAGLAIKKEDFDRGIEILERALATDAKNPELQRLLAEARSEKVKAEERRTLLDLVVQGREQLAQKRFADATITFQKALKIDPDWRDAQQGARAAAARVVSVDQLEKKGLPKGVLAGIGAGVVVLVLVLGYLLTRPSASLKELRAGEAAQTAGKLSEARALFLSASMKPGKDAEHARARELYAALYDTLIGREELLEAKETLDQIGKWNGDAAVRERYATLGAALGKRGLDRGAVNLLQGASQAYQEYFRSGYDKTRDYDTVRELFRLGEKVLERAEDKRARIDDRAALYALAQEVFTFVDAREVSLNAFGKANDARAARTEVAEKKARVDAFNGAVEGLLKRAQEAEKETRTYPVAIESYREVRKLVAQNQDMRDVLDLDRFEEMAKGGVRALEERLVTAAAAASQQERVSLLLGQAEESEKAGNLASAIVSYQDLLKVDAGNTAARERVQELQAKVQRLEGLKADLRAQIAARNVAAADARLAEALAIAPSDTDLAGLQADLGRLKKGAEEAGRVASDLKAADDLFAAGKLDEAEVKYKQIASSSSDRGIIDRTNKAIQDIRLKRVEAQIQPKVEAAKAAEGKGDLAAALAAWKEVEKLNSSFPGVKDKLAELNRAINKERIGGLEKALEAAHAARASNPAGFDKAMRDLEALDASNPTLARVKGELSQARNERDGKLRAAQEALGRREPDGVTRALAGLDASDGQVKALQEQAAQLRTGLAALRGAEADLAAGNLADARSKAEQARTSVALAADAERVLAQVTSRERAAAATPPPPVATPVVAQPTPVRASSGGDPVALAAASQWLEAARAIEAMGGQGVDAALAGRVFFNASYTAACRQDPCDFDTAKKWALAAGKYDDSTPGMRTSNPRWAKTFEGFTKCDLQLKTLCGAARLK